MVGAGSFVSPPGAAVPGLALCPSLSVVTVKPRHLSHFTCFLTHYIISPSLSCHPRHHNHYTSTLITPRPPPHAYYIINTKTSTLTLNSSHILAVPSPSPHPLFSLLPSLHSPLFLSLTSPHFLHLHPPSLLILFSSFLISVHLREIMEFLSANLLKCRRNIHNRNGNKKTMMTNIIIVAKKNK